MPFRKDYNLKVWSIEPAENGKTTKIRCSGSKKNRETGEYEQDFSGFVTLIGPANSKAASLKEGDVIRVGECEVTNRYDKEARREYVTYKIFDFEMPENTGAPRTQAASKTPTSMRAPGNGTTPDDGPDEELPF